MDNNHENYSSPSSNDWESIRQWRQSQRELLIRSRIKIGSKKRKIKLEKLGLCLAKTLETLDKGMIGFYWPIKGEFDLRNFVEDYLDEGWSAALPAVVDSGKPLEFRLWTPETKLIPGVWNIPTPVEQNIVEPSVLIVPLVGFDGDNYRLGYGGGYYDRTIVSFKNRPYAIGIGLDITRLATIYPQTHDIPMDEVITV
ncbi:MAG: 5-formyltetrahydrofolate cyclo-ligase [Proteobacteria bacterium]|nr:5-formyltetrahydrofolate cyclo-ligase [Pseudomonadota bacterium]NOG59925.1 5-formyltetrahydrofolate cyclo-ligase [Pseudomonadota bacterium]